jgi:hypothetical protein
MHENRKEIGIKFKCLIEIAYHVHQMLQLNQW